MERRAQPTVTEIIRDGKAVDAALQRGVRKDLTCHNKPGKSVVVWEDGKGRRPAAGRNPRLR